jgi:hypothetical protein
MINKRFPVNPFATFILLTSTRASMRLGLPCQRDQTQILSVEAQGFGSVMGLTKKNLWGLKEAAIPVLFLSCKTSLGPGKLHLQETPLGVSEAR